MGVDLAKKLDLLGIEPRTFPTLDVSGEDRMLRENYTTKPQAHHVIV